MKNVQFAQIMLHLLFFLPLINSFSDRSCNLKLEVELELLNHGFHRNITYSLTFSEKNNIHEKCYVGVDQVLPAGVYVSPDELADLMRTKKLTVIPRNRINTELPAEEAQPSSFFMIEQVIDGKVNLWLPVHARYHRAIRGGGFYYNKILLPQVFIRCPHRLLEECDFKTDMTYLCSGHGSEICVWDQVPYAGSDLILIFGVPVGNLDHYHVVVPVTAAAVFLSSLYLLKTLHIYKLSIKRK